MSLFEQLDALGAKARDAFASASDPEVLDQVRVRFLGRSGELKEMMGRIKDVAKDQKGEFGKRMNELKNELESLFETAKSRTHATAPSGPRPDPTLPGRTDERGSVHLLTQTWMRVAAIFERMGFSIADGPELEDEFHNFEALNIPADHPARDDQETFALEGGKILRSQTSTVQIRVMESTPPPIRIISPGRVYRPDTVDATHHYAFHQIEGLAVDHDISFADLKGVLEFFAQEMFGEETKIRLRPSFFPFTEPSAEVDVSCIFCGQAGCRICKRSGWIEVLGCGMVDPNVFESVGYDPEEVSGFAFGMGIERIAMLTRGVDDIRRFLECDLRFLRQF